MSAPWNDIDLAMPTDEPMVVKDEVGRLVLSDAAFLTSLVRRLQITSKHFARDPLWEELWLMSRLVYRNNSQHRRAVFFQKLLQIRKQLRRLQTMELASLLRTLAAEFPAGKDLATKPFDKILFPSRNIARFAIARLQGAAKLIVQTIHITEDVSRGLLHMVAKTEFMPFVVTMLSLLSRVRLLLIAQVHEMSDVFSDLVQCERVLPGEKSLLQSVSWPKSLLEWSGLSRSDRQDSDTNTLAALSTPVENIITDDDIPDEQTCMVVADASEDLGEAVIPRDNQQSLKRRQSISEQDGDIDPMTVVDSKKKKKKKKPHGFSGTIAGDALFRPQTTDQPSKQTLPQPRTPTQTTPAVRKVSASASPVEHYWSTQIKTVQKRITPSFWLKPSSTDQSGTANSLSTAERLKQKKKKKEKQKDDKDDELDRLFDLLE